MYPSARVLQLDAGILDGELFSLLKQQLSDAFHLLGPKSFSYNLHPELWSLILKLILFCATTLKTGSSYGYRLQNLKLSDTCGRVISKRLRYVLLVAIIAQYLFKKAESYLYSMNETQTREGSKAMQSLKQFVFRFRLHFLKVASDFVKTAGLFNFVSFLVQGRYSSLLHRVLGIVATPLNPDLLKFNGDNVSFEFQNRQLVWNVMTEFLVFVIPLLHVRKWRRLILSMFKRASGARAVESSTTRFSSLPVSQCAMCIETAEIASIKTGTTQITNPYATNCGHVFCYICLVTRKNAVDNGRELAELCPRCSAKIVSFKEYGEEVDDAAARAAAITVDYKDNESDADDIDDIHSDGPEGNDGSALDSHGPKDFHYSENEDLEEEMDENPEFDDGYDSFED